VSTYNNMHAYVRVK